MTNSELIKYTEMYREMLFRLAYSATLNRADSEDIVQEAFIRLYMSKKKIDSETAKAWLIRVTVNLCKNRNKLYWNRQRSEIDENAVNEDISDVNIALRDALKKLPQNYRTVIYLHYYAGYQVSEIGKLLGLSITAVTTRLQRGREKLKEFLDD